MRRDPRQPVADEHRVGAHTVTGDDVRDAARPYGVVVNGGFQADPAAQHETRQPIAGRRRHDGGDLDVEQTHATELFDVDGAPVNHRADNERLGSRRRENKDRRAGRNRREHRQQKLHRVFLSACTHKAAWLSECKASATTSLSNGR